MKFGTKLNIKETLNIKLQCMTVYNEKYMKDKVREFGDVKQNFLNTK